MSINEIRKYFEKQIIGCSMSTEKEDELFEKLEYIIDDLLGLEREIEDELEAREEYEDNVDYQTLQEQDEDFLYENRMC